jgi:hypothetical protein
VRQKVNSFIRHSGEFDAVIDFDRAVPDPANPSQFLRATPETTPTQTTPVTRPSRPTVHKTGATTIILVSIHR